MGRPTKLTPEIQERIVRAIKAGVFPETAAQHAGVGRATFYAWMAHGRRGRRPYRDFLDAVHVAEADAEVYHVGVIARAAKAGEWRASLRFLEIRFRERYGRRLEVTGPDGQPLTVANFNPKSMTTADLEALVDRLQEAMRHG